MSESEMKAELERLRAENAQLKNKNTGGLSLKVLLRKGKRFSQGKVKAPELSAKTENYSADKPQLTPVGAASPNAGFFGLVRRVQSTPFTIVHTRRLTCKGYLRWSALLTFCSMAILILDRMMRLRTA
jgi:hypothetical protein